MNTYPFRGEYNIPANLKSNIDWSIIHLLHHTRLRWLGEMKGGPTVLVRRRRRRQQTPRFRLEEARM